MTIKPKRSLLGIVVKVAIGLALIPFFLPSDPSSDTTPPSTTPSGPAPTLAVRTPQTAVPTTKPKPTVVAQRSNTTSTPAPSTPTPTATPSPTLSPMPSASPQATGSPQPDSQALYNKQYAAVQSKLTQLRKERDAFTAQEMYNEVTAVNEYIDKIQNNFPLTPVTPYSIKYEKEFGRLFEETYNVQLAYFKESRAISNSGTSLSSKLARQEEAARAADAKISSLNQQVQDTYDRYRAGEPL